MAQINMELYEDVLKEITKKFYYNNEGEGNGENIQFSEQLQKSVNELPVIASENNGNGEMIFDDSLWISSDEIMPWTTSKIASYNKQQQLFRCNECECIGFLSRIAEHWLGTHANLRVFQCSQCSYSSAWARCVRMHLARQHGICPETCTQESWKENPVLQEVVNYLERLKSRMNEKIPSIHEKEIAPTEPEPGREVEASETKKYECVVCTYKTDRKDLFKRHENIHKTDKPFQCNVCQKQFTRADHIKKHFMRLHREHEYHLTNVKRYKNRTSKKKGKQKAKKESQAIQPSIVQCTTLQEIIVPNEMQANELSRILQMQGTSQIIIQPNDSGQILLPQLMQTDDNNQDNDVIIPQYDNNAKHETSLLLPQLIQSDNNAIVSQIIDQTETNLKKTRTRATNRTKKEEKIYTCSYCPWTGSDGWCSKRHLNTHTKPFECGLCNYKAARAERLLNHVFRLHDCKRACSKSRCKFVGDTLEQVYLHQMETHGTRRKRKAKSHQIGSNGTEQDLSP